MDTDKYCISLESIQTARGRVESLVSRTPVLTSSTLDGLSGRQLFFKCEFMQKTGSFKARGATNALVKNKYPAVVTHSSGNHGQVLNCTLFAINFQQTMTRRAHVIVLQALAWAAKMTSTPAYIVMPSNSPDCKIAAVKGYGGIVTLCEPNLASRESTSRAVMESTGAAFVHPYNDPDVMAGQGTMALELLEQVVCYLMGNRLR